jgi:hypothetical protein
VTNQGSVDTVIIFRAGLKRGSYNESVFLLTPKFQQNIMFWGTIWKGYKSKPMFLSGNVVLAAYIESLCDNKVFEDMRG